MPTDALVNEDILSLVNGVSQQPAHQRLPSQHEAQENMLSDEADGVTDRPPMDHVAKLTGSVTSVPTGGFKVHTIDRGDGQQFGVFIEDGDINVYDLSDGSEVVVNDNATGSAGSYDYLDFDTSEYTAEEAFAVVTVADYTFIVNRTIAAAMSGVNSAGRENDHEGILWVDGVGDAVTHQISVKIGGTLLTGAPIASASVLTTEDLVSGLGGSICGNQTPNDTTGTTAGSTNWRFTRKDAARGTNLLYFYQFQNANEIFETSDNAGGTIHHLAVTGVNGEDPEVPRFSDLPAEGRDGFVVKVSGTDGNSDDDFYVKWDEDDNVWKETVKPDLDDNFDADTMPHALVYDNSSGEFTFEPITWLARLVGDTNSAPEPSFIGKTINDVFLHQNRLCFVADENVIASEAGEFFNFWPTTVTALVDSDPIDTAGTGDTVAIWDFAIPYRGNVTCFSATGGVISELIGSRDENLKVENARLVERLYQDFVATEPVNLEDTLYFVNDNGIHSQVYSYRQTDVDVWRADEISAHVPTYIPSGIVRMSGSPILRMLALLSDLADEDSRLYIYRYFNAGNEQLMSSWSVFSVGIGFGGATQILSADFIGSKLYLFIKRADGVHLETMDFSASAQDTTLGYPVLLDSRVELTGVYSAGPDTTTFTLPYDTDLIDTYRVVKGNSWQDGGEEVPITTVGSNTLTVDGDVSAASCFAGREYARTLELSEQFVRSGRTGSRERTVTAGRLNLKRGHIAVKDCNAFDVQLKSRQDGFTDTESIVAEDFDPVQKDKFSAPASGVIDFTIGEDSRDARILIVNSADYPWLPIGKLSRVGWNGRFFQASDDT